MRLLVQCCSCFSTSLEIDGNGGITCKECNAYVGNTSYPIGCFEEEEEEDE